MSGEYNEAAYRDARTSINPSPCVFEKALLATCVACSRAGKHLLAERETINCRDADARQRCAALRAALRAHASFALGVSNPYSPVPHSREIKAQCGGLKGLQHALSGRDAVSDVHALVTVALSTFSDLDALPYAAIVRSIAQFNIRKRD